MILRLSCGLAVTHDGCDPLWWQFLSSLCRPLCRFPSGSAWPGRPRLEAPKKYTDLQISLSLLLSLWHCLRRIKMESSLGLLCARPTSKQRTT